MAKHKPAVSFLLMGLFSQSVNTIWCQWSNVNNYMHYACYWGNKISKNSLIIIVCGGRIGIMWFSWCSIQAVSFLTLTLFTLWGRSKWLIFSRWHFLMCFLQRLLFFHSNLLKFVLRGSVDHMSTLIRVMAWCWAGDKPLAEPISTQFISRLQCVNWTILNLSRSSDPYISVN